MDFTTFKTKKHLFVNFFHFGLDTVADPAHNQNPLVKDIAKLRASYGSGFCGGSGEFFSKSEGLSAAVSRAEAFNERRQPGPGPLIRRGSVYGIEDEVEEIERVRFQRTEDM